MVIKLNEYRNKKHRKEDIMQNDTIRIPVYKRIFELDGILYGEFENGSREVLMSYCNEKNK